MKEQNNYHNFEQQIKNTVEQFDQSPDAQVWEGLDKQLGATDNFSQTSQSNFGTGLKIFAGLILVSGFVFLLFPNTESETMPENQENTVLVENGTQSENEELKKKETVQLVFKEELLEARAIGKKFAVYVCMDKCPHCERLREETLTDPEVDEMLEDNFLLTTIDIRDNDYQSFLKSFEVRGAPALVFFDTERNYLGKIIGYRTVEPFLNSMNEILDRAKKIATISPENPTKPIDVIKNTSINIAPNPSNGQFKVKIDGAAIATQFVIIDINGKKVVEESLDWFTGEFEKEYDLTNYPKGTYFLNCYQKGNMQSEQIIIQ